MAEVKIATKALYGGEAAIHLEMVEAPEGLIWALSAADVLPGEAATLTLRRTDLLAEGSHTLRLTGDDGRNMVEIELALNVRPYESCYLPALLK